MAWRLRRCRGGRTGKQLAEGLLALSADAAAGTPANSCRPGGSAPPLAATRRAGLRAATRESPACMCSCGLDAAPIDILPGQRMCWLVAVATLSSLSAACRYISSDCPGKQQLLAWLTADLQQQLYPLAAGAAAGAAATSSMRHQHGGDDGLQPAPQQQEQQEDSTSAPHQQQAPLRSGSEGEQAPGPAPGPPSPAARSCCCW